MLSVVSLWKDSTLRSAPLQSQPYVVSQPSQLHQPMHSSKPFRKLIGRARSVTYCLFRSQRLLLALQLSLLTALVVTSTPRWPILLLPEPKYLCKDHRTTICMLRLPNCSLPTSSRCGPHPPPRTRSVSPSHTRTASSNRFPAPTSLLSAQTAEILIHLIRCRPL